MSVGNDENVWRGPYVPGTMISPGQVVFGPPPPPGGPPYWPTLEPVPKGCICPPGSEATCQRSDCGRKDPPPPTTHRPLS